MKHIFVDFEMHPISNVYQFERTICQREIIEFGAVMLDENFKEISSFKEYVNPEYVKEIYKKISILTGITKERLVGASRFNIVFANFVSWCKSFDSEFIIYAWSDSDYEQITKELNLKKIEMTPDIKKVLDNWIDFQKDYCELIKADRLVSLEKALNSIGQFFVGDMHDALWDARNTADLFTVTRDKDSFFNMLSTVKSLIVQEDDKSSGCKLGDMFDFNSICLV